MTQTATQTVTDFLLARIAEDEAAAKVALAIDDPTPDRYGVFGPHRVLAECEAKRRIVADHVREAVYTLDADGFEHAEPWERCELDFEDWPCDTLAHLAAVYSDHPDYRREWKP